MYRNCLFAGAAVLLLSLFMDAYSADDAAKRPGPMKNTHLVLVGASIGKTWNLPEFPQRESLDGFTLGSLTVWQYDKSDAVKEILMWPKRKFRLTASYFKSLLDEPPKRPDIVILKECSSYFPGDETAQQELMKKWIDEVQAAGMQAMVTTVVPVTRQRAERDAGKMEGIRRYNDWIREYARQQHLVVVDLEAVLREDPDQRFLREEFTSGDGSHLNRKAYDLLDRMLLETLCQQNQAACGAAPHGKL